MTKVFENKEGYCFFAGRPSSRGKRVTLQVTVMLDPVPGAMDKVEDHVNVMMRSNLYIQSISVEE